jgi:serine/threonine protein phosphatase 1
MFRMLLALIEQVRQRDGDARFYFVGDYVNRGPESKQVVDLLSTMRDARFVRGNHDEIFDLVINGKGYESHPEIFGSIEAFLSFLPFGLDATLMSYGIDSAFIEHVAHRPSPDGLKKLLEPVPESHRKWFAALPAVTQELDLLIAHAKWEVDLPNDSVAVAAMAADPGWRHVTVWGRFAENEIRRKKAWQRQAVFGHTPISTYVSRSVRDSHVPLAGPQIILLDTGAALSMQGRLTAVCVEEREFVQIDRGGNVHEGVLNS